MTGPTINMTCIIFRLPRRDRVTSPLNARLRLIYSISHRAPAIGNMTVRPAIWASLGDANGADISKGSPEASAADRRHYAS